MSAPVHEEEVPTWEAQGGVALAAKLRWFGAEIVVVVAGVLIALALNAWWQHRQELREERQLVGALLAEVESNRARLGRIVRFHAAVKETALSLLALSADPPRELTADSVDQLLTDVSWWGSYVSLETAALDAAVQDGQLDLLRTDSLRRLVGAWRAELAGLRSDREQERAFHEDVWMPLLRAETELGQVSNATQVILGAGEPYLGSRVPLPRTPTDHRRLLGSRSLRNALVQKLWIEDDVGYRHRELERLLPRLRSALRRELTLGN